MSGSPTVLAALAGVCAAVAIVDLAGAREGAAASPRGAAAGDGSSTDVPSGDSAPAPSAGRGVRRVAAALGSLGRRLGAPAPPRELAARLDAAGRPLGMAPGDLMAVKCGAALAGALLGLPASSAAPGRLGVLVLALSPLAGFLAPDALLRRLATRRRRAIELDLPDVCELLRVAVEAGLSTTRAIGEVGRRHPGLLASELRTVAHRTGLGVPRGEALRHLLARAPSPAIATLVAAIERADRHGAPLGPALDALAADARAERARAIRDRAARAAPQIQLVVALLLVPAVLLLVAAALVAGLAR
jgi:tight adherence protein C